MEELIEEVLDSEIVYSFKELWMVGLAGAALGGGVGYFIGVKRMKMKFEELVTEEVESVKQYYADKDKFVGEAAPKPYSSPAEAVSVLIPDEEYVELTEAYAPPEKMVEIMHNDDAPDIEFDFDAEVANRESGNPYVITRDEFYNAESGFDQSTLTFYSGDSILSDDDDEHIPMIDELLGEDNIVQFGYGSGDPDTVFIRNPKLEMEFEVLLNQGKYAHIVLGLEHSDGGGFRNNRHNAGPPKFRGDSG